MAMKTSCLKWFILSISLITAGCEPESTVSKSNPAGGLAEIQSGDKTTVAAALQSIIRNAYKISVQHKGYEPKATPSCPAPEWKPQDMLVVDENGLWTKFNRQHWINRTEEKSSSGYWTFYKWRAYKGKVTKHNVWIRFKDVTDVKVDRPLFSRWITVSILYSDPFDTQQASDSRQKIFTIWFDKSGSNPDEYKRCLASLETLCPDID